MLARPRLVLVAAVCAVGVLVPVGVASAGTTAPPSGTPDATATGSTETPTSGTPTPGQEPAPSPSPSDSGTSGTTGPDTPRTDPGPTTSYGPLPSASSSVGAAPRTPAPPVPDRLVPVEPTDGIAPAAGQVDEFLRLAGVVTTYEQKVADARTALRAADDAVVSASQLAMRASLSVSIAGMDDRAADDDATDVVRELYQQGDSSVANLATVVTLGPDGMLERLYNLRAMRGAANDVVNTAEEAAVRLEAAKVAQKTAVARVRAAMDVRADAELALRRAKAELVNADAQLARLGMVAPQVQVGPEGCPTQDVPATLRDGAELIGAKALCTKAVKAAATPQAALAITWAFRHLGAAYACGGAGRMLPFRADCSSFVSRAYAEGAGLNTAGAEWAPSTRNMVPWDGVALDPHYAKVAPAALRPGDLVLYDTCPQGGCPYKHVVMYLGHDRTGGEWMMHTNSCGDVAKVERFWGFPTSGSHTFLVARRVLALDGEVVQAPSDATIAREKAAPGGKPATKPATPRRTSTPAPDPSGALGAIG